MLDFLGDLGGFYQAIDLLVFLFGQFFSAKLFIASISSTFYYRKLSQDESKENLERIEKEFHEDKLASEKEHEMTNSALNLSTFKLMISSKLQTKIVSKMATANEYSIKKV